MGQGRGEEGSSWVRRGVMVLGAAGSLMPWVEGAWALGAGCAVGLLGWGAWGGPAKRMARMVMQAAVVMLGLRLDLSMLARAAADGLALAIATIVGTVAGGLALGSLLRCGREERALIASGTAICGGSAIAAVGSAMRASASSMAVATGAIFILNAVGLYTLPLVGHALGLTAGEFGTWAGVALHDIASVGAASASYGGEAADVANVVKMTRVVWIFPLAVVAGRFWTVGGDAGSVRKGGAFPWFILLFVLASVVRTLVPGVAEWNAGVARVAQRFFALALFLIGTGLTLSSLRAAGWRALLLAVVLWVGVAAGSLLAIRATG